VIKEGDFSPRHVDNSDEFSDLELQASDDIVNALFFCCQNV
jgi:hypothetical protein